MLEFALGRSDVCMMEITGKHAAVDFQMPTICSPLVRPGRPAEVAWVVSEQLSNALSRLDLLILYG